jgi:hypothetical protein
MKRVFGLSRLGLAGVALVAAFLMMEGEAMAVTLNVCVPEKEGTAIVTPKVGVCEAKYNSSVLLPQAEAEKLEKILPHIKYEEKGVDGKPTIKFSGVNVQIVNGEGKTATVNGEGNVVIGYDESEATEKPESTEKGGSHNLILGNYQTYTSYGGIIAGLKNTISGPWASVTGGEDNTASNFYTSVTGGYNNTASGHESSVSGGRGNKAEAEWSSISGGGGNTASGNASSISGGNNNTASALYSSISGGELNTTKGNFAWVGGGYKNTAEGELSAIFGGKELTETEKYGYKP